MLVRRRVELFYRKASHRLHATTISRFPLNEFLKIDKGEGEIEKEEGVLDMSGLFTMLQKRVSGSETHIVQCELHCGMARSAYSEVFFA